MRNPLAHTPGRGITVERGFALRDYTPDPRFYEMMTILSPDVSEDDLPAHIETIAGYITTAGGTVNETLRESPWGRRRLAYSIRHTGRDIRDGFYTVFHFTLDPGGVRDIERDLKLNDQVMRFLITHYTPKPVVPGAATEGGEPGTVEGVATTTTDAAVVDSVTPVEATVATEPATEPASEPAEATAPEAAVDTAPEPEADAPEATAPEESEAVEAPAEDTAFVETSDTEAASADTEPAEDAPSDEVPTEEAAAVESAIEESAVEESAAAEPAAAEPAAEAPAVEESTEDPAEPTAPAKDDEEA